MGQKGTESWDHRSRGWSDWCCLSSPHLHPLPLPLLLPCGFLGLGWPVSCWFLSRTGPGTLEWQRLAAPVSRPLRKGWASHPFSEEAGRSPDPQSHESVHGDPPRGGAPW